MSPKIMFPSNNSCPHALFTMHRGAHKSFFVIGKLHMHPAGLEPTTSHSTLLLQGIKVSFEPEIMPSLLQEELPFILGRVRCSIYLYRITT